MIEIKHEIELALDVLLIYTVYGPNTRDYPGKVVVRQWRVTGEGTDYGAQPAPEISVIADTLTEAREPLIRAGLHRLPRSPADEPQIVESWI